MKIKQEVKNKVRYRDTQRTERKENTKKYVECCHFYAVPDDQRCPLIMML